MLSAKRFNNESMTQQRRITLKDVAKRAGVATGTVSMVLNENPLVAEATRARVQRVIQEIGYIYDRGAAQLRKKRTNIVGASICNLLNPYFAETAAGIEATLDELGKLLVIGNSAESARRQARFLDTLLEYNIEGVLMTPAIGTPKAAVERLFKRGVPLVMMSRYVPGIDTDYVGSDNHLGSVLATRHVIELGHRRVAFVGTNRRTTTGRDRVAGFRAALREAGLAVSPELQIECDASREAGFAAVRELFNGSDPPTAVICFNDLVAFGFMLGLRHIGLEAGPDCSVVGADDVAEAALWMPPLTTVVVDVNAMGRAAGRILLSRISGDRSPAQHIVLPPRLVVRSSCGPVPARRVGKKRKGRT